jgi:UDP-glucuronate 4-epimerase
LTNIIGTQTLLQTIAEHGSVRQFVYISTRSTFGQVDSPGQLMTEEAPKRPINPYGASKVGAEAICHVYHHLHGIDVNIIRIFALYGPYGRPDMIPRQLMEKVVADIEIPKFGTGEANRDWMYVEDAAEAVLLAVDTPLGYQIFNIGTGRGTSLNELIATAEKVIGKTARILHLPVPPGDAHFVGIADNSKAKSVLGWTPKTSLEEGMRKTLETTV